MIWLPRCGSAQGSRALSKQKTNESKSSSARLLAHQLHSIVIHSLRPPEDPLPLILPVVSPAGPVLLLVVVVVSIAGSAGIVLVI